MLGEWKVSEQVREAETRKRDVEIPFLFSVVGGWFSCWAYFSLILF